MRYVCLVILALLLAGGLIYAGLVLIDDVDETGVIGLEGRLLTAAVLALLLAVCTATAALVVLVFSGSVIEEYLLNIARALERMFSEQVTYRSTDKLNDTATRQLEELTKLASKLEGDLGAIRGDLGAIRKEMRGY